MPHTNIPKPHTETENERLVLLHRIEDTAETPLAFLGLAWPGLAGTSHCGVYARP